MPQINDHILAVIIEENNSSITMSTTSTFNNAKKIQTPKTTCQLVLYENIGCFWMGFICNIYLMLQLEYFPESSDTSYTVQSMSMSIEACIMFQYVSMFIEACIMLISMTIEK